MFHFFCRNPQVQTGSAQSVSEVSSKDVGVLTNNQRGQRSGPCCLCGSLDKARHVVRVSQIAIREAKSTHGCKWAKYKTYYFLDDPWVILSTSKEFYYFCSRQWIRLSSWSFENCKHDHRKRPDGRFLLFNILKRYSTKFWKKKKNNMFTKPVISVTLW